MKKENKCFDFNSKQKHYENWKKLIKNLGNDKPNQTESKNKEKEKKTFEGYFQVSKITRCYYINRLDYNPLQGA